MNWSAADVLLVPPKVVTVTSTGVPGEQLEPEAHGGEVAVMEVSEFTVKAVAAVVPKSTAVAPVNPVPVIVTAVLPAGGPLAGEIVVTVGTGDGTGCAAGVIAMA